MIYRIVGVLCFFAAVTIVLNCGKEKQSEQKLSPPAKVQNIEKEVDLTTITLSPEAEKRLGIQTAVVEYKNVERTRVYGGEIEVVSGRSIVLSAPLPGTLLTPEDGSNQIAGKHVKKGQSLCRLVLLPSEQDLLSAEENVTLKKVELDVARANAKRTEQLLNDKAGSIKQLEQAKADLAAAEAALKVSQARLDILKGNELKSAAKNLSSLNIESPIDGVIQKIYVSPDQTVAGGTNLIEITSINPIWIRVPVYVGDLAIIDDQKPALIHSLSDFKGKDVRQAKPITSPLTANPNNASVNLYFELKNSDIKFRPGQRVSATLTLLSSEESLIVPYSAIIYDMYGGAWVYENPSPQIYVRRRVEIHHVTGDLAVLSRGTEAGTNVVTAGVAELFGTEFGGFK
ncbi:efflux RND transporter periplasmic adaptor subunit [candidate division KSB1 bacterium]